MRDDAEKARQRRTQILAPAVAVAQLFGVIACQQTPPAPVTTPATELRIGFGSTNGQTTQSGLRHQLSLMEREGLVFFGHDGRPQPWLADRWTSSPDGLELRLHLKENVRFHDGSPMTAAVVAQLLLKDLPGYLGPPAKDIKTIEAVSEHDLRFALTRRSNFLLEGLDLPIEQPQSHAGTGPFVLGADEGSLELLANPRYHDGSPLIDRLVVKTYDSTRAAWAEMLRGEVDMLYEVGGDTLDSLQPASTIKVFAQQRPYAYLVILNMNRPALASAALRRQLNAAIDRKTLIADGLYGHGVPTDQPVWPWHWAADPTLPVFNYAPMPVKKRLVLTCLFADASLERLAMAVQKQLAAIGVELKLELQPVDEWYRRVGAGDFDLLFGDVVQGPALLRPSWFWRSDGPFNWGHYKNVRVDDALDAIRGAADEPGYRAAVGDFQRAMVDDPPAIFLAWSERARAVSTRFAVPVEPGRDILSTLRLWKPIAPAPITTN